MLSYNTLNFSLIRNIGKLVIDWSLHTVISKWCRHWCNHVLCCVITICV